MKYEPKVGDYIRSKYGHELREIVGVDQERVTHVGVKVREINGITHYIRSNVVVVTDYRSFVDHWVTKQIKKNRHGVLDSRA